MSSVLKNKDVLLGITGSIAAYKAAEIIRLLRKKGARVYPIMTKAATHFIHPLTFQTLASREVAMELFKQEEKIKHLSLSSLAHVLLIAPASANIIGKIAHGIADDLLTTTVLATEAPIVIAPAMNQRMYRNPILQENLHKLRASGFKLIGPEKGELASGEVGWGRMTDPAQIVEYLERILRSSIDFQGRTFLVTAGPTREPLDSIRFITNYSSGKMGYALAEEGISRGAKIILISGPTSLNPPTGVEFHLVESAEEMREKVVSKFSQVDGVLMAAAVSDYRPKQRSKGKIKKSLREKLILELVRNPDILKELGEKKEGKILTGFSAETRDLEKEAKKKLKAKNLDLIASNDITLEGAGFGVNTNRVTLMDKKGRVEHLSRMSKREVAEKIWDKVKELMQ